MQLQRSPHLDLLTKKAQKVVFEADERGAIINPQKPLCKRCYRGLQTKGGNTSNLAKHLKDRHPDLFKEFKVIQFQKRRVTDANIWHHPK